MMPSSFALLLVLSLSIRYSNAAFSPQGSAKAPLDKKKVAVIGSGGYTGAITFGFLQRAGSLYGTGISPNCRCIGATSATALALNSILSKHFCLAQADESFIKLTNLESIEAIQQRLEGYDAVILGNEMVVETRPVTAGSYEKTPNDKTKEVFWDIFQGNGMSSEAAPLAETIIDNTLQACKLAGIKHVVGVSTTNSGNSKSFLKQIKGCSIPYSLIECPGALTRLNDYTYRRGVQGDLRISTATSDNENDNDKISGGSPSEIHREDIAALCVQCLQSLDWSQSRHLVVSSNGPVVVNEPSSKRPDQEWVVNSHVLADELSTTQ